MRAQHAQHSTAACAGLGSREIAGDEDMVPVRGQVRRMRAPWQKHAVMLNKEFYVLPNVDSVVVGGTQQRGDERGEVDAGDTAKIWEAAVRMCPGIAGAEPLTEWVRVPALSFRGPSPRPLPPSTSDFTGLECVESSPAIWPVSRLYCLLSIRCRSSD